MYYRVPDRKPRHDAKGNVTRYFDTLDEDDKKIYAWCIIQLQTGSTWQTTTKNCAKIFGWYLPHVRKVMSAERSRMSIYDKEGKVERIVVNDDLW